MYIRAMITADLSDLKKLRAFFKQAPELLRPASANVLSTLAFKTRTANVHHIETMMVIRNRKFIEDSLQYKKAKSVRIEKQIAFVGSIERPRFTGWREQEFGTSTPNKQSPTLYSRGGSKRGTVQGKYRMHKVGKAVRPEQFQGRTLQQRFGFMMRVLGTRKAGFFYLRNPYQAKSGELPAGMYYLRKRSKKGDRHGILKRIQSGKRNISPVRKQWMKNSIAYVMHSNDIVKIWGNSVRHIIRSRSKA